MLALFFFSSSASQEWHQYSYTTALLEDTTTAQIKDPLSEIVSSSNQA